MGVEWNREVGAVEGAVPVSPQALVVPGLEKLNGGK